MANSPRVKTRNILRVKGHQSEKIEDLVVTEEPLEIRLGYGPEKDRKQKRISITMRTPGHDFELSLGFLFGEGIISAYSEVTNINYCPNVERPEEVGNVVKVELRPDLQPDIAKLERNFYMTSSCGVCGKASIEALDNAACQIIGGGNIIWPASLIHKLPALALQAQQTFRYTGGIHAASLFDQTGKMLLTREDIGRHNAVDKIVGSMLLADMLPGTTNLLLVSGRAGFELVQKTIIAGIPVMAAIGAPSSLAVELAATYQLSLLGFVRNERFNIYTGTNRIKLD